MPGRLGVDADEPQRFRHYRQLYSRLGFSHRYRVLGRDDLLFVLDRCWRPPGRTLDREDFTDAQAIAATEGITRGNFRLLKRLFPRTTRGSKRWFPPIADEARRPRVNARLEYSSRAFTRSYC